MTELRASIRMLFAVGFAIIISCSARIVPRFLTLVKQIMVWYNLTMKLTEEIVMTAPTVKIGGDAVKVEEAPAETPENSEQPQE
jgi:hypothetical protein